jgi:hypothetical protein
MSTSNLIIENKHVQTAPGIKLSEQQQTIVGSVLDLFAGRPSLPKLALWRDDATFTDPLTIATGRDKFAAQWYGLQQAFSEIERLNHQVTDSGNPILMDLRTRYVIKGINKEQTIQSVVAIHLDDQGKISKVEDKWDGKLPEGSISQVSSTFTLLSLFWWTQYLGAWAFWLWSLTWETRIWRARLLSHRDRVVVYCRGFANSVLQAFRHLNAVTVPKVVSVPKNDEEDAKNVN